MKKSRHSIILLCLAVLLLNVISSGQESEEKPIPSSLNLHQWGSLTLFHGLPSNHVRAIAQDADGILWFGTDSGLAKYDGRRIQKVTAAGLPAGPIRVLKLDADGVLWVGTDNGATVFSGGQFRPIPETDGTAITAISSFTRGQTVLVSEQGTIFKFLSQNNAVSKIQTLGPGDSTLLKLETNGAVNPLPLTSIYETKDTLMVGSRGRGLLSVSGREIKEILSRPRSFFVNATAIDANGHLWLGGDTSKADSGVYQSEDVMHPQKTEGTTGAVKSLSFDQQNSLWVGTDGQGAFRFKDSKPVDHFTFENTAGGLRSNLVFSVFADRENVIWFGTDRGVCRYDPHSPHIDTVSDSPDSNFVRALYRARDGRQWCGTNRGLFTRDDGISGWRQIDDLTGKTIHSINQDQTGRILVGTAGGLYTGVIDPFSLPGWYRFTKPEKITEAKVAFESIRSISYFRDGIYLASYGSGIEQLDGDNRKLIWPTNGPDLHQRNVVSLYADGTDRLWIGTADAGAFYFDGNLVTTDPGLAELQDASVWSIAGNIKDGLWLATSRGLYRYAQGKLQQILKGNDYRQVVAADEPGSVWCATTGNGLYKVVFNDASDTIISRLDTEHGLPSDVIFTILPIKQTKDETVLWLGTNHGVAYYEPGKMPAIVRAVRALGKRVYQPEELPAGLHLAYPQNSLVVEVAASSSRTFPEHFQYLFTLMNDAGKVIKKTLSTDPQFPMENLRPGGYRVIARAYTNDLVVSQPIEFHFEVAKAPFPWTSTALAVLLALALVVLWLGYKQSKKISETNVALAGANQQLADTRMQLANETERERRRIARDLHDQTLSDLRRLMLLTDQLPKEKIGNGQTEIDPAVFRTEIESISTEIRHICEDLSPSVLANVGLSAALEWALSNTVAHLPVEQKFEYEFSSVDDLEEQFPLEPGQQIQIYRIVQEAISNVGHHAAARHVKLNVGITETQALLITLEDDGRGFDPDNLNHGTGRGLNNIRSRASLVDADVSWIRKPEGGIIFTLHKGS